MRYVCLIYTDPRTVFNQSPESDAVLAQVGPHNEELRVSGHFVTAEALVLPKDAITVRVRDGKMPATDGPFMETKEWLGGYVGIEARALNEAGRMRAGVPSAN